MFKLNFESCLSFKYKLTKETSGHTGVLVYTHIYIYVIAWVDYHVSFFLLYFVLSFLWRVFAWWLWFWIGLDLPIFLFSEICAFENFSEWRKIFCRKFLLLGCALPNPSFLHLKNRNMIQFLSFIRFSRHFNWYLKLWSHLLFQWGGRKCTW